MRFVSDMWCFEVSSYRKTYLKITLRWFPHWSQHTCRKSHVFLKWEWSFWVKTLNFQLPSFSRNERNLPLSFWKAADWEFSFQELGLIAGWFKRNWVAMKLGVPLRWYCWRKKSCTSWYGRVFVSISGGAGFLPSTVPSQVRFRV